jgi:hypothetical protein
LKFTGLAAFRPTADDGDMKLVPKKPAKSVKPKPAEKNPREDLNQAAARIIREATERD